jgi:TIGR03009 family protein
MRIELLQEGTMSRHALVVVAVILGGLLQAELAQAQPLAANSAPTANLPPAANAPPQVGTAPFPPMSPQEQKFLDDVLNYWQQRSQAVERYRCTFRRWDYDPVFGPANTFKTYSEGSIKYSAPDKGMYKIEKTLHWTAPTQAGGKPTFVQRPDDVGEHWICDGQSVFEHDAKNKQLIQRELPPDMRGKAIAEGPLPFLFGADAAKIKHRYWIHPLPVPPDVKGEYWLEAYPKTRQDAVNYQKVHVIIAQDDFLPKGLVIFDRNFDSVRNPARSTFTFENREVNWSVALQQLNLFNREFYEPKPPFGWKKVVEKYDVPPDVQDVAPAAAGGINQARLPIDSPPRR